MTDAFPPSPSRSTVLSLALAAALALGIGCSRGERVTVTEAAPKSIPAAENGRIEMTVTKKGYEPSPVRVKKGEPLTLSITRTTDATCATEIVIPGYDIEQPLPLNETVTVTFTPRESGELKYGCAMRQMISGVLYVE